MLKYVCFLLLFSATSFAQLTQLTEEDQKYLTSKRKAEVFATRVVDDGEFERAELFISQALKSYPRSDHLLTLYGQTLYESRDIEQAESYFMAALQVNPLNKVAKAYVEVIRETSEASTSQELQQFQEVLWDKVGDIVVFGLGFFFGSMMSGWAKRFLAWRFINNSRKTFLAGDFEDYADMLEIQLTTNELKPLRNSLNFMLEHRTLEQAIELLEQYVNNEDNLKTLTRMLRLSQGLAHANKVS